MAGVGLLCVLDFQIHLLPRDSHRTATAAGLEEKERLEHLIVKDFKNDAKGHKERLMQGHRVRERLEELQSQAAKLVSSLNGKQALLTPGRDWQARQR